MLNSVVGGRLSGLISDVPSEVPCLWMFSGSLALMDIFRAC